MVGGEHSLKMSAPQLLWFGIDIALNIFPQTITYSVSYPNHKAVYRTALGTPGLLKEYIFVEKTCLLYKGRTFVLGRKLDVSGGKELLVIGGKEGMCWQWEEMLVLVTGRM